MRNIFLLVIVVSIIYGLTSCSKKTSPVKTTVVLAAPKRPTPKPAVAKIIIIADSTAQRTFDGRYYYDLMGHRYWRNSKDGKYYLYNKSMSTDPAFRKP